MQFLDFTTRSEHVGVPSRNIDTQAAHKTKTSTNDLAESTPKGNCDNDNDKQPADNISEEAAIIPKKRVSDQQPVSIPILPTSDKQPLDRTPEQPPILSLKHSPLVINLEESVKTEAITKDYKRALSQPSLSKEKKNDGSKRSVTISNTFSSKTLDDLQNEDNVKKNFMNQLSSTAKNFWRKVRSAKTLHFAVSNFKRKSTVDLNKKQLELLYDYAHGDNHQDDHKKGHSAARLHPSNMYGRKVPKLKAILAKHAIKTNQKDFYTTLIVLYHLLSSTSLSLFATTLKNSSSLIRFTLRKRSDYAKTVPTD